MIDLTKKSPNLAKLRQGNRIEELDFEIVVDSHLSEADLPTVEVELNKKRKKKHKAELANAMISPASSVRGSRQIMQPIGSINRQDENSDDE